MFQTITSHQTVLFLIKASTQNKKERPNLTSKHAIHLKQLNQHYNCSIQRQEKQTFTSYFPIGLNEKKT